MDRFNVSLPRPVAERVNALAEDQRRSGPAVIAALVTSVLCDVEDEAWEEARVVASPLYQRLARRNEALDAATLQQFCAEVGTRMSYAGLPVITSRISSTLRMFVFVSAGGSTGGVVYTLLYSEENTPLQVKWLYDSILATFRPEFSATACR